MLTSDHSLSLSVTSGDVTFHGEEGPPAGAVWPLNQAALGVIPYANHSPRLTFGRGEEMTGEKRTRYWKYRNGGLYRGIWL